MPNENLVFGILYFVLFIYAIIMIIGAYYVGKPWSYKNSSKSYRVFKAIETCYGYVMTLWLAVVLTYLFLAFVGVK